MAKSLVIVESPAKAATLGKFLGRDFSVMACYGHVRDLQKKGIAVDRAHGYTPSYEILPGKERTVQDLRKAAKGADAIYLAADPDREGEAICYHLQEELNGRKNGPKIFRGMFKEITKKAIQKAFEKPLSVNLHLVDAQQARRILDRLVGYKISPLLWDKVRRGLSAGRVQTVALRLIVERERLIKAFIPREYWTIHARLQAAELPIFQAKLSKYKSEDIEISTGEHATRILEELKTARWQVSEVVQKEKRRTASPPFTTSKLHQASYNRLRYTAKRSMR